MIAFNSVQEVLAYCDPHHEHICENAGDADENALLISRDYKPDSVLWQMAHLTVAELAALRIPTM